MPAIPQVTKTGPRTYTPAVGEFIRGGDVVEARAGGRIGRAAAGSTTYVGVAVTDARSPEDVASGLATPTIVDGRPVVNAAPLPTNTACAYAPTEVPLVFSAACAFGQLVVCTGDGKVGPAGAAPDARTIVGRCTAPNGVSAANKVGLVRLGI